MKGRDGSSGGVMINMRLRVRRGARVSILMLGFCIKRLWVDLMLWSRTRIILLKSGRNAWGMIIYLGDIKQSSLLGL